MYGKKSILYSVLFLFSLQVPEHLNILNITLVCGFLLLAFDAMSPTGFGHYMTWLENCPMATLLYTEVIIMYRTTFENRCRLQ